jgi:hypothetical protein
MNHDSMLEIWGMLSIVMKIKEEAESNKEVAQGVFEWLQCYQLDCNVPLLVYALMSHCRVRYGDDFADLSDYDPPQVTKAKAKPKGKLVAKK